MTKRRHYEDFELDEFNNYEGPNLDEHPFAVFMASEREGLEGDRAWELWCRKVEWRLGIKTLDGNFDTDGYCLDFAYDAYKEGKTPAEYAKEVKDELDARG